MSKREMTIVIPEDLIRKTRRNMEKVYMDAYTTPKTFKDKKKYSRKGKYKENYA